MVQSSDLTDGLKACRSWLKLILNVSSHLRAWNVLSSFSLSPQLATMDPSFNLSSNITSAGDPSWPPRPGQAHHGLLSHTQLLMNVTLVTFEPLVLILPPLDCELLADCLAHSWPTVHVRWVKEWIKLLLSLILFGGQESFSYWFQITWGCPDSFSQGDQGADRKERSWDVWVSAVVVPRKDESQGGAGVVGQSGHKISWVEAKLISALMGNLDGVQSPSLGPSFIQMLATSPVEACSSSVSLCIKTARRPGKVAPRWLCNPGKASRKGCIL